MFIRWPNGFARLGRDFMRADGSYVLALSWGDLRLIGRRPPMEGEYRFASNYEITWHWPQFRGVRFRPRWCADWRDVR